MDMDDMEGEEAGVEKAIIGFMVCDMRVIGDLFTQTSRDYI